MDFGKTSSIPTPQARVSEEMARLKLAFRRISRTELARGAMVSLVIKLASTGLGFAVAIVLARMLGAEGYGLYSFVFALVTLGAIPAQLGLPQIIVRETAKAQALENWGKIKALWRWGTVVVGVASLGLAAIALFLAWLFRADLDELQLQTYAFGIALIPLVALGNMRGAALRGLRRIVLGQLPELILRPVFFVLMLSTVMLLYPAEVLAPYVAMCLHVAAAALAFALGAVMLWRSKPSELKQSIAPLYESKKWFKAAIPLAFVSGMMVINQNSDILMIGLFLSAEEVGIYKVAVSVATLVAFGLQAVTMAVSPHFARLYAQGDMVRLQRLVSASARIILLMALPIVLVLMIWGEVLLGLIFGQGFTGAHWPLTILALGQLVNAFMGGVGALLNMTGHEKETARGVAVAAAVNVVLNLLLIPLFGTSGAAYATALSMVIWNYLLWRAVVNGLNINCMAINLVKLPKTL